MKLNDRVKIWIAVDESDYATNCFGVEPWDDWYVIQYFPKQIEARIIRDKKLILAQHIYKGKEGSEIKGEVFDISQNGIKNRIDDIKNILQSYNITIQEFFENDEISNLDCFFDVVLLDGK